MEKLKFQIFYILLPEGSGAISARLCSSQAPETLFRHRHPLAKRFPGSASVSVYSKRRCTMKLQGEDWHLRPVIYAGVLPANRPGSFNVRWNPDDKIILLQLKHYRAINNNNSLLKNHNKRKYLGGFKKK